MSFVVGSFVLADSLPAPRSTTCSRNSTQRSISRFARAQAFECDDARDPIHVALAEPIRAIEGVAIVEPILQRYAQLIDDEGEAISPPGGPTLGVSWEGDNGLQGVTVKDRARSRRDQMNSPSTRQPPTREGFAVGDTVSYLTDVGTFSGTITGTVGLGDADSFGGAQLVALDLDTALDALRRRRPGRRDRPQRRRGRQHHAVQRRDRGGPASAGTEVVTGEEVAEETADAVDQFVDVFGTGLLIFAFVTAFVSVFIINNVFQITIGQRLRELALLRAVGASGTPGPTDDHRSRRSRSA